MISLLKKLFNYIIKSFIFCYIVTELKYLYEGVRAVADDIKLKKKNKCELFDLTGKVAVVTGGARGIGSDVVKKLLQCNLHVIIGCRNISAGKDIIERIRNSGISTGICDVFELDLTSFSSIRNFAKHITEKTDRLHILVNNAGIMFPPFMLTEDGFESQWQVNYLAPVLLSHLLFPLIRKSSSSSECRIVNISSCAHKICDNINYPSINIESGFNTAVAYATSKAAQISFSLAISKLFKDNDIKVSVFAVHPGIVNTDLFNGTPIKTCMPWLCKNVFKSQDDGATSVLYCCISPKLTGLSGLYLSNCRPIEPSKFTRDSVEQKKLFTYSLEKLNIQEFGLHVP